MSAEKNREQKQEKKVVPLSQADREALAGLMAALEKTSMFKDIIIATIKDKGQGFYNILIENSHPYKTQLEKFREAYQDCCADGNKRVFLKKLRGFSDELKVLAKTQPQALIETIAIIDKFIFLSYQKKKTNVIPPNDNSRDLSESEDTDTSLEGSQEELGKFIRHEEKVAPFSQADREALTKLIVSLQQTEMFKDVSIVPPAENSQKFYTIEMIPEDHAYRKMLEQFKAAYDNYCKNNNKEAFLNKLKEEFLFEFLVLRTNSETLQKVQDILFEFIYPPFENKKVVDSESSWKDTSVTVLASLTSKSKAKTKNLLEKKEKEKITLLNRLIIGFYEAFLPDRVNHLHQGTDGIYKIELPKGNVSAELENFKQAYDNYCRNKDINAFLYFLSQCKCQLSFKQKDETLRNALDAFIDEKISPLQKSFPAAIKKIENYERELSRNFEKIPPETKKIKENLVERCFNRNYNNGKDTTVFSILADMVNYRITLARSKDSKLLTVVNDIINDFVAGDAKKTGLTKLLENIDQYENKNRSISSARKKQISDIREIVPHYLYLGESALSAMIAELVTLRSSVSENAKVLGKGDGKTFDSRVWQALNQCLETLAEDNPHQKSVVELAHQLDIYDKESSVFRSDDREKQLETLRKEIKNGLAKNSYSDIFAKAREIKARIEKDGQKEKSQLYKTLEAYTQQEYKLNQADLIILLTQKNPDLNGTIFNELNSKEAIQQVLGERCSAELSDAVLTYIKSATGNKNALETLAVKIVEFDLLGKEVSEERIKNARAAILYKNEVLPLFTAACKEGKANFDLVVTKLVEIGRDKDKEFKDNLTAKLLNTIITYIKTPENKKNIFYFTSLVTILTQQWPEQKDQLLQTYNLELCDYLCQQDFNTLYPFFTAPKYQNERALLKEDILLEGNKRGMLQKIQTAVRESFAEFIKNSLTFPMDIEKLRKIDESVFALEKSVLGDNGKFKFISEETQIAVRKSLAEFIKNSLTFPVDIKKFEEIDRVISALEKSVLGDKGTFKFKLSEEEFKEIKAQQKAEIVLYLNELLYSGNGLKQMVEKIRSNPNLIFGDYESALTAFFEKYPARIKEKLIDGQYEEINRMITADQEIEVNGIVYCGKAAVEAVIVDFVKDKALVNSDEKYLEILGHFSYLKEKLAVSYNSPKYSELIVKLSDTPIAQGLEEIKSAFEAAKPFLPEEKINDIRKRIYIYHCKLCCNEAEDAFAKYKNAISDESLYENQLPSKLKSVVEKVKNLLSLEGLSREELEKAAVALMTKFDTELRLENEMPDAQRRAACKVLVAPFAEKNIPSSEKLLATYLYEDVLGLLKDERIWQQQEYNFLKELRYNSADSKDIVAFKRVLRTFDDSQKREIQSLYFERQKELSKVKEVSSSAKDFMRLVREEIGVNSNAGKIYTQLSDLLENNQELALPETQTIVEEINQNIESVKDFPDAQKIKLNKLLSECEARLLNNSQENVISLQAGKCLAQLAVVLEVPQIVQNAEGIIRDIYDKLKKGNSITTGEEVQFQNALSILLGTEEKGKINQCVGCFQGIHLLQLDTSRTSQINDLSSLLALFPEEVNQKAFAESNFASYVKQHETLKNSEAWHDAKVMLENLGYTDDNAQNKFLEALDKLDDIKRGTLKEAFLQGYQTYLNENMSEAPQATVQFILSLAATLKADVLPKAVEVIEAAKGQAIAKKMPSALFKNAVKIITGSKDKDQKTLNAYRDCFVYFRLQEINGNEVATNYVNLMKEGLAEEMLISLESHVLFDKLLNLLEDDQRWEGKKANPLRNLGFEGPNAEKDFANLLSQFDETQKNQLKEVMEKRYGKLAEKFTHIRKGKELSEDKSGPTSYATSDEYVISPRTWRFLGIIGKKYKDLHTKDMHANILYRSVNAMRYLTSLNFESLGLVNRIKLQQWFSNALSVIVSHNDLAIIRECQWRLNALIYQYENLQKGEKYSKGAICLGGLIGIMNEQGCDLLIMYITLQQENHTDLFFPKIDSNVSLNKLMYASLIRCLPLYFSTSSQIHTNVALQ